MPFTPEQFNYDAEFAAYGHGQKAFDALNAALAQSNGGVVELTPGKTYANKCRGRGALTSVQAISSKLRTSRP